MAQNADTDMDSDSRYGAVIWGMGGGDPPQFRNSNGQALVTLVPTLRLTLQRNDNGPNYLSLYNPSGSLQNNIMTFIGRKGIAVITDNEEVWPWAHEFCQHLTGCLELIAVPFPIKQISRESTILDVSVVNCFDIINSIINARMDPHPQNCTMMPIHGHHDEDNSDHEDDSDNYGYDEADVEGDYDNYEDDSDDGYDDYDVHDAVGGYYFLFPFEFEEDCDYADYHGYDARGEYFFPFAFDFEDGTIV